eukprot:TRINITY_DN23033_c0_g1_i1.p1 TRINITY_DN23033_c0_g1~~TRINITY_DN23033_c0_g1_i1.p1  ORF type:complete len:1165 (-),score=448.58 TRINITY_DN23033_c0_g1_i1:313-3702(-)
MSLYTREEVVKLQRLLMSFLNAPRSVMAMYEVLDQSDLDRFSKALMSFSLASGSTFTLVAATTRAEFEKNKSTPASILRGNTAATKLMTLFCRHVGQDYLIETLSELVQDLVTDAELDLEVDPAKREDNGELNDAQLSVVEECRGRLRDWISKFLESITSQEGIELLPRPIKAMCYNVLRLAREYEVENNLSLVGGFILLRFVNPSLISPETYGLCKLSDHTGASRRHLTLITKALQNISNQRMFNEDFMLPLNDMIEEQIPHVESYLRAVCIDTLVDDDADAFQELFSDQKCEDFDVDAVDLAHWKFFAEFLRDEQDALLESMMSLPEDYRDTQEFKTVMEELAEYGAEDKQKHEPVELYFSPLCPFSRSVWMFCLENRIKVSLKKVDLLKKDQELDITFKKFKSYSKSLKTPLLVDGDVVLEESHAILIYLCEKFFLPSAWYPFGDLRKRMELHQTLNFIEREVHAAVVAIWTFARTLSVSSTEGPSEDDQVFVAMKKLNALIGSCPYRGKFAFGANKSLVDLSIMFVDTFCQLHYGYASTAYPHLSSISMEYQKSVAAHLKKVNAEFQGFAQYVITVSKKDSLPKVEHTVFLQETPHTVYEVLLDPENDIFLFLASKTISTKTNAKVKMGLKKLNNSSDKEELEAQEKEKVPYVVALDVGGKFNIQRREGTNLVLVPGNMIVQESHRTGWPEEHSSTELFELYATKESRCKLVFTQMNCPIQKMRESEDQWDKFWRKINGFRTRDMNHSVFFKGKAVSEMYSTFSDIAKFAKLTKTKVREEEEELLYLHNKSVVAKYVSRCVDEQIVQDWRCVDWEENHWSSCTLTFSAVEDFGCRVVMLLSDVPLDRWKHVEKLWKDSVWKKLGGVLCGNLRQRVVFREAPQDLYTLWTTQAQLETKLRAKSQALPTAPGESFSFFSNALRGTVLRMEPGKRMRFSLSHKDWPTQHPSVVELDLYENPLGTLVMFSQDLVPVSKLKSMEQLWTSEFWEKMGAVQTEDIHASMVLNRSPDVVYGVLTSSSEMSALTASECEVSTEAGGDVMLCAKSLRGKVLSMAEHHRIVWNIRAFEWPYGHSSEMTFELAEHNAGKGTLLMYTQKNIPLMCVSDAQTWWETLSKDLRKHCQAMR